ncbi:MAG: DHA2 family efflux MFS transporter permease subunit [Acidimicrobiales bacterium]|nr:DHA2 family efflux MFS transporter permease subunit [Acidimicrobiales bacterium]
MDASSDQRWEDEPDEEAPAVPDGSVFGIPYRWVAMFVVLFGTFMVALDTTVVNLGLPSMQRDFGTIEGIEWVVTAYLAAVGVTLTMSGWLADRFGRKQMFVFSLGMFTLASLLCAMAPTLPALIGFRLLQGVAGGMLMPVVMAMIYELFEPHERGKALGYFGIAVMAAPAIGPVLGGSLVASANWRWLFLINIPVGLVGFPVAIKLLKDTGYRERRPLDVFGFVLAGVGVSAVLVGFERGASEGWSHTSVVVFLATGVVLLTGFVIHALRTAHPLLDIRILAHPVFAVGMATIALMSVAQFSRLVYVPLQLGTVRGVDEFQVGLVMLPSALGIALTMSVGGRLADRVGARIPVSVGLTIFALSFLGLASLRIDTPLPVVGAVMFAGGIGAGLAMMPPNILAMNSVTAPQVSQGSSLSQVSRQMSSAIGTAIMASIFATIRIDADPSSLTASEAMSPFRTVFLVAFGFLVVAVIVAQWEPGKAKALELQEERRQEMRQLGIGPEAEEAAPAYAEF